MIRTLIFDYDGTIHNTKHLYGEAFRSAYAYLVEHKLAPERAYTDDETSIYLGMTKHEMWETFRPDLPEEIKEICGNIIGTAMDEYVLEGRAVLYDHAMQTLRELKERGYHLLILSNCRISYMDAHRKAFSLDEVIDDYYVAEAYDFIPKEDIFRKIREQYPGEYVIIGDRDKDIRTALVHGLRSVGCTYGFALPGELDAADIRIGDISELTALFR
ncbi:MAG: HAD hydrolase-like protein [Lachnospiraceae bacterium]|nr:HAD hydrolase-like protein [Lachnospiraceae bacterium]MBR6156416.1 HAD hydrolase-like protein [Lachnospiraceae bacterium]